MEGEFAEYLSATSGSDFGENEIIDDTESQLANSSPSPTNNISPEMKRLYKAALKDNWGIAERVLRAEPSLVRKPISVTGDTVLDVAVLARSSKFVGELMKLMERADLEVQDSDGNTAFCYAALFGFVEIAKAMRDKNPNLPNIRGQYGKLPITMAASMGNKAMVSYLFNVTRLDPQQDELFELLESTIQNEMYDVALRIINKERRLTSKAIDRNPSLLISLAKKPLVISNQSEGGNWVTHHIVRACSPVMWRSMARRLFTPWFKVEEKYLMKEQAACLLLEKFWKECGSAEDKLLNLIDEKELLHTAAKAGNLEFIAMTFRNHPDLIWKMDSNNRTVFHVAVLHREEKVFSLMHQFGAIKDLVLLTTDDDGNNILHLAGKLGQSVHSHVDVDVGSLQHSGPSYPEVVVQSLQQLLQSVKGEEKIMPPSFLRVSGAALQMQREMMWFKEVEKIVPPSLRKKINKDGKTPMQLFTEEHKLLLKEGERWMKDTANSCMIVATLIATMVFAAAFTVPGGNNDDIGTPILLKSKGFTVFVISDAVALFSSIISIIMFLSILTSRYAERDFLASLPAKLLFGLTALFVSIVGMLLAFAATFFLVYNDHRAWQPKLIVACAGVPVALFVCLQYKLWLDVAKSTFWSKYLLRRGKYGRH